MKLRLLKTKHNVERFMLKQQKKNFLTLCPFSGISRRMDRLDPKTLLKDHAELAEMFKNLLSKLLKLKSLNANSCDDIVARYSP